ncbi:hypothetical protein GALL_514670 [mine drainage metagenome]|uniref:Uncharacterized protein n=1 Tax=mine drainage metagenome TaxID=410659 RepID=A0A1J5P896_9ZZZZ
MQTAQHAGDVVRAHAQAEPHVGEQQAFVQGIVAGGHAAHQQVGAAALVFGQRLHHHVHAQVEGLDGDACGPRGVDGGAHAVLFRHLDEAAQIGHFHRHRSGSFQPQQTGLRGDQGRQFVAAAQRVVELVGNAPGGEKFLRQLTAGPVHVVGQQHAVALLQQGKIDEGDGRQPGGAEDAVPSAVERGQPLLEDEGGGRAVQAVGIAGLATPVACAHGGHVGEQHGGGVVHAGLDRAEACWRLVGMVLQAGGQGSRLQGVGRFLV